MSINVAIVGVGNCASSLVQAVSAARAGESVLGLSHPKVGNYSISAIEFVAAFDVDERKIGTDLGEAIFAEPNCTTRYCDVAALSVPVSVGCLADGVSAGLQSMIPVAEASHHITEQEIVACLRATHAEILVLYLPVGSIEAAEVYAQAALRSRCALVNCTPAWIATSPQWSRRFSDAGVPLLGDDVMSQIGSTAVHRALLELFQRKGAVVSQTYQVNIGGNTDFLNMRAPERAAAKRSTKRAALQHLLPTAEEPGVGPSDYIPHLLDHKVGYINIEGEGFLGMPFSVELKLKVEDSPNSAGVVVNAIRAARVALDRKLGGPITDVCGFLFKHPPQCMAEYEALAAFNRFVCLGDE